MGRVCWLVAGQVYITLLFLLTVVVWRLPLVWGSCACMQVWELAVVKDDDEEEEGKLTQSSRQTEQEECSREVDGRFFTRAVIGRRSQTFRLCLLLLI